MLINQLVNNKQGNVPVPDHLSAVFAALADPTRRSILARLGTSSATVNEIAKPYDMSLPAVSKHLKVLEQAGLISKEVHAQRRECRLEAVRLQEATEWLNNYRKLWETSLDHLDMYLQQIQSNNKE